MKKPNRWKATSAFTTTVEVKPNSTMSLTTPPTSSSTLASLGRPIPKPMRPLAAYHLFFQIEREYIIQTASPDHIDTDPNKFYLDDVPPRYRSIKLSPFWYAGPGKRQKRKHRKSHGMIGFLELSKVISRRWAALETEDPEMKDFVTRIAARESAQYKLDMREYMLLNKDIPVNATQSVTKSTVKPSIASVVSSEFLLPVPSRCVAFVTPIASPSLYGSYSIIDATNSDERVASHSNFGALCSADIVGGNLNSSEVDYSIATMSDNGHYVPSLGLVDFEAFDPLLECSHPEKLSTDSGWVDESGASDSALNFGDSHINSTKHSLRPDDLTSLSSGRDINGNDDFLDLMSLSPDDAIHNISLSEEKCAEGGETSKARVKKTKKSASMNDAVDTTEDVAEQAQAVVAATVFEQPNKKNDHEMFFTEEEVRQQGVKVDSLSATRSKVYSFDNTVEEDAKKGPWKEDETNILLHYQSKIGNKWSEIAKHIPGRSEASVTSRWYNLKKKKDDTRSNVACNRPAAAGDKTKKGPWDEDETNTLLHYRSVLGCKWSEIAKNIPGRNETAVMNRWYYIRAKLSSGDERSTPTDDDVATENDSPKMELWEKEEEEEEEEKEEEEEEEEKEEEEEEKEEEEEEKEEVKTEECMIHQECTHGNKITKHTPYRNEILMKRHEYAKRKGREKKKVKNMKASTDLTGNGDVLDENEENKLHSKTRIKKKRKLSTNMGAQIPDNQIDLKPYFQVGDLVYSAWWDPELEIKNGKNAVWIPGEIIGVSNHGVHPCRYGPTRLYVVRYEDHDEQCGLEDYWVRSKRDYELTMEFSKIGRKPIGVIETFDTNSKDLWARTVGWYEVNVDGEKKQFSFLEDALKAHDDGVVRKNGAQTKMLDLNQPERYAELFQITDGKAMLSCKTSNDNLELLKDTLGLIVTTQNNLFSLAEAKRITARKELFEWADARIMLTLSS